ncbi:MAG: hypothetical protein QXK48_03635 [Candidatus Aenigmatarchaeota archaeon]
MLANLPAEWFVIEKGYLEERNLERKIEFSMRDKKELLNFTFHTRQNLNILTNKLGI